MYEELSLLPRQNEEFSKGEVAINVMYVGHKSTTRREQIQENWSVEVEKVVVVEPESPDTPSTPVQGSPRRKKKSKSSDAAGLDMTSR